MKRSSAVVSLACLALCAAAWPTLAAGPAAVPAGTVARIRAAGQLRCGVPSVAEDWNKDDLHGPLAALDMEICKAVSVAVLGAAAKVDVTPFESEARAEEGLGKGLVDLVVGVTPEASSGARFGIAFGAPVFYDGQGVMVRADAHAKSLADLAGAMVCVIDGTDNERVLVARAHALAIPLVPIVFQEEGEMDDGYAVRHCDAVSAYKSRLAAVRRTYLRQLANDTLLPEQLTLAPVAPAYRSGDAEWARLVDWTVHALVEAEASGVTMANVRDALATEDVTVVRLLGNDGEVGRALGLDDPNWAVSVIAVVGNYGEIYDRTVGMHSGLQLPRGINALWTDGGLMHPLPVR